MGITTYRGGIEKTHKPRERAKEFEIFTINAAHTPENAAAINSLLDRFLGLLNDGVITPEEIRGEKEQSTFSLGNAERLLTQIANNQTNVLK